MQVDRLQPGRYAISVCQVQGYNRLAPDGNGGWGGGPTNGYRYFQEFEPVGMVGYSILLYELSADDIAASRTWGPAAGQQQSQAGSR